jgi:hypothetical protein
MVSAAALASLQIVRSEEGDRLRKKLFDHIQTFHDAIE